MGQSLMGRALMGRALMGRALVGPALMGRALMGRTLTAPWANIPFLFLDCSRPREPICPPSFRRTRELCQNVMRNLERGC